MASGKLRLLSVILPSCFALKISCQDCSYKMDFCAEEVGICNKQVENHSLELVMNRLVEFKGTDVTWGNKEDTMVIRDHGNFEVIIGTDVTYYAEANFPLFETASELIAKNNDNTRSALIICHIQRRVDEGSIISAAAQFGFKLVDRWINGTNPEGNITRSWFPRNSWMSAFKNTPLSILYFEV